MQVLEERLSISVSVLSGDEIVDLVDIADIVGVNPDDGDDVEEGSSFAVEGGLTENGVLDVLKQVFDYFVELLEGAVLISFKDHVDGLEEVEGVVDDLVVGFVEVLRADV